MTRVILDTDLGTDIDDHWALALLLGSPELEVRLISTVSGDTRYHTELVTGMLRAAGRMDIPVATGRPTALPEGFEPLQVMFRAFRRAVSGQEQPPHLDAARAIVDAVRSSPEAVDIIAIGPMTNLAAALDLDPGIVEHSRLTAMAGWIRPDGGPVAEANVVADIAAFQRVLRSGWEIVLAPVDTCGDIRLTGELYADVLRSRDPVLVETIESYREWYEWYHDTYPQDLTIDPARTSSVLWDTLAVHLCRSTRFVDLERVRVAVDEHGIMSEDPDGTGVRAAVRWNDLPGFLAEIHDRLLAPGRGTTPIR